MTTRAPMHNHTHQHTCGHDHGPEVVHELYPPTPRVTAVILAPVPSIPAATARLRAPWAHNPADGEKALLRIFRILSDFTWLRLVAVVPRQHNELVAMVGPIANTIAHADSAEDAENVGVKVALNVTTPPDAILIWDALTPLAHPSTFLEFLSSGAEILSKPDHRWARVLSKDLNQPFVGGPILFSRALALKILSTRTSSSSLAGDHETLLQRVIIEDPYAQLQLDSSIRIRDFSHQSKPVSL